MSGLTPPPKNISWMEPDKLPIPIWGYGLDTRLGSDPQSAVDELLAGPGLLPEIQFNPLGLLRHGVLANSPWIPGQEPSPDPTPELALRLTQLALDRAEKRYEARARLESSETFVTLGCSKGLLRNLHTQSAFHFPDGYWGPGIGGDLPGVYVAHRLGLRLPLVANYPAACATGLVCLAMACDMLREGRAGIALAGAMEYTAYPLALAGFRNMGALSGDPCRPFDAHRNGFNTGDGGAVFVLGQPQDGGKHGAGPIGWIHGWCIRSSSHHPTAAEPSGATLVDCMERTLAMAGWRPDQVDGICAHATGTLLNDAAEAKAIHTLFGHLAVQPRVFSFKGAIGHLLGASAAAELALTLAVMEHGIDPGNCGLATPDPALDTIRLSMRPARIAPMKRVLKISLGFGGPVAVVAVEVQ